MADRIPRRDTIGRRPDSHERMETRSIFPEKLVETASAIVDLRRCNSTTNLTLTTSYQSIIGNGNNSKVRLLLPIPGRYLITAFVDFHVRTVDPGVLEGVLFVDDSGSEEDQEVVFSAGDQVERGTVGQQWIITTTDIDIPVELKAKKQTEASSLATANQPHTTLTALGIS